MHVCYPVTAIEFAPSEYSVSEGEAVRVFANIPMRTQSAVNQLVEFRSSDSSVAAVDENGLVTGVQPGKATIYAEAQSGVSASCTVTVPCTAQQYAIDHSITYVIR